MLIFLLNLPLPNKKTMRFFVLSLASLLLLSISGKVCGQIGHGGTPFTRDESFSASKVIYLLEPEDKDEVAGLKSSRYNTAKKALTFAIEKPLDLAPEFNGEWISDGDLNIWRAHIISPGAYSLGIYFSEFELGPQARIFLFDPSRQHVKGSYTSQNNKEYGSFAVGHIPGDELIVELQVKGKKESYGRIRLGTLSHAFLPVYSEKNISAVGLGTSQACEIDINCEEGDDWQTIKNSVCYISTGSLLCTGALVNNTLYDGIPYILTAEHCINKEFRAQSSVFYFGYENSECGIVDARKAYSVSGSALISTGDSLDFSLLKLSSKPPKEFNVYYAGWDVRKQNHLGAITLHHPNADAMKISVENQATVDATSLPGDLNDYILESNYKIRKWDIGSTEGGSSGGPLFNTSKRLIGCLSGGLATCGDSIGYDAINDRIIFSLNGNENDYYSKLYYDWDYYEETNKQLKKWLDPTNSGQLSIGGLSGMAVESHDLSINENLLEIYPNPSRGEFTIELPYYSLKQMEIALYNSSGQEVWRARQRAEFPFRITLPDLADGIYFIRLSENETNLSGLIMLNR